MRVRVAAVVVTALLCIAAWATHPAGNVARVLPFAATATAVWVAATWMTTGRRAAGLVLAVIAACASAGVLVYVVAIEPIPYAECGVLAEELRNRACRGHASTGIALGAAAVLVAALVLGREVGRVPPD